MAYLTREFVWLESDVNGNDGWIPRKLMHNEKFFAGRGLSVAHDTLEHFMLDASMEDELMAFGAIWYGRIENGRLSERGFGGYSDHGVLARDLVELIRDCDFETPKPLRMGYSENTGYLREQKDLVRDEFLLMIADEEDIDTTTWRDCFDDLFAWVHKGYCAARRRWHGENARGGQYAVSDVFWGLEQEVNKNHMNPEDGDLLIVRVNCLAYGYTIEQKSMYAEYE